MVSVAPDMVHIFQVSGRRMEQGEKSFGNLESGFLGAPQMISA